MYIYIKCVRSSWASPGQLRIQCRKYCVHFYYPVYIQVFPLLNLPFKRLASELCCVTIFQILYYTFRCFNSSPHLITGQTGKGEKPFIPTSNMTGPSPAWNKRFHKELRIQLGLGMNPLSEIRFWSHQSYSVIWIKVGNVCAYKRAVSIHFLLTINSETRKHFAFLLLVNAFFDSGLRQVSILVHNICF